MQGTDLREFRRLYGYGVVDAYRTQADEDARAEATPTSLVDPELAAADALVAEHCASSGYDEIRDVLPPAELVQRYDALVMGAADDPDYLTASVRWLDCMSSVGYRSSVLGPYFAKGVVEEKIIAAQGVATGRHFVDYDSLQAAELLIFEADAECLASSGAGSVMLDLEQRILDTLRREFPNYTPVSQDPAGLAWMAR